MKTYIVNPDGLTAREKNPWPKYPNQPPKQIGEKGNAWKYFESTVQSYPIITDKPLEPGSEIECEVVWQYRGILEDEWANENQNAYNRFKSFNEYSIYAKGLDSEADARQALQPIEQPKEEKKEIPNSTSLIESCRKSLQGWKDELKRNGESLGQVNEHSYTTGYMNGYFEASTKNK